MNHKSNMHQMSEMCMPPRPTHPTRTRLSGPTNHPRRHNTHKAAEQGESPITG